MQSEWRTAEYAEENIHETLSVCVCVCICKRETVKVIREL